MAKLTGWIVGALLLWAGTAGAASVSGTLENGYRILPLELGAANEFVVFRGDYVKFRLPAGVTSVQIQFPRLGMEKQSLADLTATSFFKMKKIGEFGFSAGALTGTVRVVEYEQLGYRAVSARDAMEIYKSQAPLVLDVRTPREFKLGHLQGALLIPVQRLRQRLGELSGHESVPILIYCATGNRSVVASKILMDAGFTRIINLKGGIAEWKREGYPVTR